MKYIFTFILASAAVVVSYGQDVLRKDTTVVESSDPYKVVANRFGDNIFFQVGGGVLHYFGDHNRQGKFTELLAPNFSVNLGKWFSPGFGARVGASGFKMVGLTQGPHSTGERYEGKPWEGYWLSHSEFNYYHIHGDAMFNLTNLLGGYKERFYNIIPYAGLGWMVNQGEPSAREVSANVGLYNTFALSKAFDLTLDIRGGMVNDRFDGTVGGRKEEGLLSGQLGIAYNFAKRDWDREKITTITYDEQLLDNLRDRVDALSKDNEALRQQLANAKTETITDVKIEKQILAAPILVTFPINKWTVSNEARVNLGFFAKVIKEADPSIVYTVTGYADAGTGTPAINERLSKNRADAIYDVLVKEHGVSPQQLIKDHKGGVDNMYYDDPRLSRAVITIAR